MIVRYHADGRTGQIMFFYPQSGSQFVVEGFIIGFLNLGCAAALIFLGGFAPNIKSNNIRNYGLLASIFIFSFCFIQIRSLYIMKNRWYGTAN